MDIIRVVQNGVEFYTRVCDGESGMSQSGIARLVSRSHQRINKIISRLEEGENAEIKPEPKKRKEDLRNVEQKHFTKILAKMKTPLQLNLVQNS
jgi:hypothetical protein